MRLVLGIIAVCSIIMGLFSIVNWIVYKKLSPNNSFRKFWKRHICWSLNWMEEDELEGR